MIGKQKNILPPTSLPMVQAITLYLKRFKDLTQEDMALIADCLELKKKPKGEQFSEQERYNNTCYLVVEGLVREYVGVAGNEYTTNIYTEFNWIIKNRHPATNTGHDHRLMCLEETTLLVAREQKIEELIGKKPHLERVQLRIVEEVLLEQQDFKKDYLISKPEQRYRELLGKRPDLFNRMPLQDIASYIGVTPQSLSRIRRNIQQKSSRTR
jgi:CRP-like cAMP-binding protein